MGIFVPLKTVLNLLIIDYQGFCPEAGIGIIMPLKTVHSLQIIIPLKVYVFGIVCPSILSVWYYISVPIGHIWLIFGIDDKYHWQSTACKFLQNQIINTWVFAIDLV